MAALDRVYDTGRHIRNLWRLAKEDVVPDKYRRFMELEAQATVRQEHSVSTVPGILQTKAYAREVLALARPANEEVLAEQVALRLSRQSLIDGDQPQQL